MAKSDIQSTNNTNRNVARMQADGGFRETNMELEYAARREARINWEYEDKSMLPKHHRPFFEQVIVLYRNMPTVLQNERLLALDIDRC